MAALDLQSEPVPAPRRLLRRAFLGLLGLLILCGSVLYGLMLYGNRDQESNFYLRDAELRDASYLDKLDKSPGKSDFERQDFGFHAHRLKPGRGLILAHRYYSGGGLGVDDESYLKLTIWLPNGMTNMGERAVYPSGQAVLVASSGGSAWPRNDCSGHVDGTVEIKPLGHVLDIQVEGMFKPMGNSEVFNFCKPRNLALKFQAALGDFQHLSPWQGGTGGVLPLDETYPRREQVGGS